MAHQKNKHWSYPDSGRGNHPNHGGTISGRPGYSENNYGYNLGRNYNSNLGGRSYGQSYSQYHQGSYNRLRSNERDYEGNYNEHEYGNNQRDYHNRQSPSGNSDPYDAPEQERMSTGYNAYSSEEHNRGFYRREDDYYYYDNQNGNNDSYPRFEYRQRGYQNSGNMEGFGQRGSNRNNRNWDRDDDYPEGNAQNHRSFGKYGSR
jgi:hypothetical protein